MFWIIISILFVLALGWPIYFLLMRKHAAGTTSRSLNLVVYRDRLEELKRDAQQGTLLPEQFAEAKEELAAALLQDIKNAQASSTEAPRKQLYLVTGAAVVLIALLTFGVYRLLSSQIIFQDVEQGSSSAAAQAAHNALPVIAEQLRRDINNPALWEQFGQSFMQMDRPDAAMQAFGRALTLGGESPGLLLQQAQVVAMSQNGSLEGQPADLIARALAMEPNSSRTLVWSGLVQMQHGQYDYAISLWARARANTKADSPEYANLSTLITRAEQQKSSGAAPTNTALPTTPESPASAPTSNSSTITSVNVTVDLSPQAKQKVKPTDTIFIFARAINGPSMPLAVLRRTVSDLPLVMTMDDSNAMDPQLKLSQYKQVQVVARVSLSGEVMAQPGDWYGEAGPFDPHTTSALQLTINKQVPGQAKAAQPRAAMTPKPSSKSPTTTSGAVQLKLNVELSADLAKQVKPDETLFIFARAANGPPMPLAAVRKTAGELPLAITLDDSSAMSPQLKLSQYDSVKIVARISRGGSPTAQSGDLFGEVGPLNPHQSKPLTITINQKVP